MVDFIKKVGLAVLGAILVAGLFNWVFGAGEWNSFGRAIVWGGVLLMLIGTLAGAGDYFNRPSLQPKGENRESREVAGENPEKSRGDFVGFLVWVVAAVLCFGIGTLLEYLF